MAIFGFFGKDKIENENKRKPFHANRSAEERRDWFSRTRPWHNVSPRIIDALIEKFDNNPLFEVFVITSMERGLVSNYEALGHTEQANFSEIVCPQIANLLYSKGSEAGRDLANLISGGSKDSQKLTRLYGDTVNMLETSIVLSDAMIISYCELAGVKSLLGKTNEAIQYIDDGLRALEKIEDLYDVMAKSTISSIANAPQDLAKLKTTMLSMRKSLVI